MRARVATVLVLGCVLVGTGVGVYVTSPGTVAIQIHDTPASWSHLTVTFSRVEIHPADAAVGNGWVSLSLTEPRIDFLSLGTQTQILALDHVAPGAYDQLRLVVASVDGILSGGATVSVSVSDGMAQVSAPFALHGGARATVTVDLDLAQSIQDANGAWVFTPVLGPVSVG